MIEAVMQKILAKQVKKTSFPRFYPWNICYSPAL